jgi:hypothetical protein
MAKGKSKKEKGMPMTAADQRGRSLTFSIYLFTLSFLYATRRRQSRPMITVKRVGKQARARSQSVPCVVTIISADPDV